MLASSIDVMLKRLSVAHCYSLTAPVGIATGCISLFFCQKSLNWISAQSAYCKLQARTAKHSVLQGSSLNCVDKFLSIRTCMFIVCILNLCNQFDCTELDLFSSLAKSTSSPPSPRYFKHFLSAYWDSGTVVEQGG